MAIELVDLPPGVANLLQQMGVTSAQRQADHASNGAQRQADGAALYAENLRYDYLVGKNRISFAESTGVRHVEESGAGRVRGLDASVAPNPGSGK